MKKAFIIIGIFLSIISTIGILMFLKISSGMNTVLEREINEIDFSEYSDGIYQGEFYHDSIGTKVLVEIADGEVISINYENHQYAKGGPAEDLKYDIIDSQSIQVDDIAGATTSSRCIKLAIINAFE